MVPKTAYAPLNAFKSEALSLRSPWTTSTPFSLQLVAFWGCRVTPRTFQPSFLRKTSATDPPWPELLQSVRTSISQEKTDLLPGQTNDNDNFRHIKIYCLQCHSVHQIVRVMMEMMEYHFYIHKTNGKNTQRNMDRIENRLVSCSAEALFCVLTPVVVGHRYKLKPRCINQGFHSSGRCP